MEKSRIDKGSHEICSVFALNFKTLKFNSSVLIIEFFEIQSGQFVNCSKSIKLVLMLDQGIKKF